jgi:TPR repeat protein
MDTLLADHELLAREPDPTALYHAHALLSTNPQLALANLEALADRGYVMALLYIANEWRLKGKDSYPIAEKWYRLAYEKKSATGLWYLALIYYDQQNYDEAEKILKDDVSRSDGPSMYWLADLYLAHYQGKRDEVKALLEQANAMGQFRAKSRLARLLITQRHDFRSFIRGSRLYFQSYYSWTFACLSRGSHRPSIMVASRRADDCLIGRTAPIWLSGCDATQRA